MMTPSDTKRTKGTTMAAGKKKSKNNSNKQSTKTRTNATNSSSSFSPLSQQQWNNLGIFCAISSLLLYFNCMNNAFVFDDFAAVVQNPDVLGESSFFGMLGNDFWATPLRDPLSNKSWRPLTTLSYRWSHLIFGMNPRHFHFTNILLNAVCAYLVVKSVQTMTPSSVSWMFPVITCLLFCFHPIHTEVVATVVGRADLLSSIFSLLAYLSHSKCPTESIYSKPFLYTLLLAWMSALCKETGLMILGILGAKEVIRVWFLPPNSRNKKTVHASIMRFLFLALTGISYLLVRKIINGPSTGIMPSAGDNPLILATDSIQYGCTALYILVIYLWKLVFPFQLLCDYGYNVIPLIYGWSDVRNVMTMLVGGSVLAMTILALRTTNTPNNIDYSNNQVTLLALAWILIPLLPASHILTLGTVVAERLLYLPSIGFCMLISLSIEYISKKLSIKKQGPYSSSTMIALLVIVLAAFTQRIISRNDEWSTTVKLWKADYHSHPQNVKIALAYAADLHQAGKDNDAYQVVENVEGLGDVQQFEVCALKAKLTALSDQQDYTRAYAILDECVKKVNARTFENPSQKDHVVFAAYGYLLSTQEELEQAAEWFRKATNAAERAKVNVVGPICNQGEILARMQKWEESVSVLRKCADLSVRARDDDGTKLMNLAKANYMIRNFDQAEQVLMEEMTQTPEVVAFLETVRDARAKIEKWNEKKRAEAMEKQREEAQNQQQQQEGEQ